MGAAWCRNRAEKAHDSKSPLDRVIVKCVNQMSLAERPIPAPVVVQGPAKYPRLHLNPASGDAAGPPRANAASEWQDVVLKVPDAPQERKPATAPIPPPRKKRMTTQYQMNHDKQEQHETKKEEEEKCESVDENRTHCEKKPSVPGAPAIYLEVDTPSAKHRVKSSPLLVAGPGVERKRGSEGDLLGLPPRSKSSLSLRSVSPVSEATAERLDNYMKSCRSFGSLKPEDILDEISQALSDTSSEDSWHGVDDWEHYQPARGSPPLTPTSQITTKSSPTRSPSRPKFVLGEPDKKKKKSRKERDAKKANAEDAKSSDTAKSDVKSTVTVSHDDTLDVLAPPANFQTDPKSHIQNNKGSGSLIKPSQISVQDFLRQSNNNISPSNLQVSGKPVPVLPELKLEVPGESTTFSFDFSKGLMPPRSPQIEIPGTPNSPQGLSRCSSPLPPTFTCDPSPTQEETLSSWTAAEDDTTANLLRIMQEYHFTAGMIGDRDAKKILEEVGIPESLLEELPTVHKKHTSALINNKQSETVIKVGGVVEESTKKSGAPEENGSSGMSSMTPSLTELEASLSELLEASAVNDDDEFEEELQNQTSQVMLTPSTAAHTKTDAINEETKKPTTQQKENILEAVISQEVPKILPSQPEEISHSEDSSHKSKGHFDVQKITIPTTEAENRSHVITLVNAV